jgi:hypothetical protein
MIGDSIEADVAGRRQRGLKAALVRLESSVRAISSVQFSPTSCLIRLPIYPAGGTGKVHEERYLCSFI